jgi:hypothetical protein
MSQTQLDFAEGLGLPQGAVAVNQRVWFQDLSGNRAVFVDQTPFYCYPLTDETLHRFCAIQLVEAGVAKVKAVCQAFDIHPRNFSRLRTKFRQQGIAGLIPEKTGPKPKRNPTLAAGIVQLYRQGKSTYDIATQLGISASTVRRVLKEQGVQLRSPFDYHKPLQMPAEDGESQRADELQVIEQVVEPQVAEPQVAELQVIELQVIESQVVEPQAAELQVVEPQATVEATSIPYASPVERMATIMGWIEEAPVEFQSTDGVSNAGVLLGLALLEETHLLEEARAVYSRLKNGWYGLRSLLWTLVIMALLRIKRPEQLKHHDPASLGRVLGLPRAAEVKTLRRKLIEIADRGQAAELHRRMAQRRAAQEPSALATLYVDGHVRAYHGKHRIGQTHISRLKRVMRAETDYWVHEANGQPLLVVHQSVDTNFREALRDHVLPEIRQLVGDRRVRIVFDREGWSRELFHDLLRLNFDFVTYRKGPYQPLPESDFESTTFQVPGQPAVHYELAETVFEQEGWPRLRLVAVKKKNGGQTHVLATGRLTWESLGQEVGAADLPAAEIAWWMFHRWSQENWFKYMRTEYALDVLVDYSVELDDATRPVVNPRWRELDRQVASARSRLEHAEAKYARLVLKVEEKASEENAWKENSKGKSETETLSSCLEENCECLACRCRGQASEVAKLSAEYERLRAERRETPRKVPLSEASDRDDVKLSYERKLFTDTIKLSAYEIETRLYEMLGGTFCNSETEGRGLIQEILGARGDLRVGSGVIEVHLDQLSAPRYTEAMQSLCGQLNALSPSLPETSHALRFFVKPRPVGG